MQLITDLEAMLAAEESVFRSQLLREDIARLRKLQDLAAECEDVAAFKKAGSRIGWTQRDMMTHLISDSLGAFLEALYERQTDADIESAWRNLCRERNEKLIKCL